MTLVYRPKQPWGSVYQQHHNDKVRLLAMKYGHDLGYWKKKKGEPGQHTTCRGCNAEFMANADGMTDYDEFENDLEPCLIGE